MTQELTDGLVSLAITLVLPSDSYCLDVWKDCEMNPHTYTRLLGYLNLGVLLVIAVGHVAGWL